MNVGFCDGGLSNRLNSLIFCLILAQRYGHQWRVSWPRNNWCGAPLGSLFSIPVDVDECSLDSYKHHLEDFIFLVHENQIGFPANRVILNSTLASYPDYEALLGRFPSVLYMHNLLPAFVQVEEIRDAFSSIKINEEVLRDASTFCQDNSIDQSTFGLHIRKTDFGDRVDDVELFKLVAASPQRFFVCSDDEEVNDRFGQLPNCRVYKKSHFPVKRVKDAEWQSWTTDGEGRQFPFNIERSQEATVEGLIDLLILSRTTPVRASHSTFFNMALLFKNAGVF